MLQPGSKIRLLALNIAALPSKILLHYQAKYCCSIESFKKNLFGSIKPKNL